jgi:pimeloyl-ACP methyl ester carboxylesterase
MYFTTVLQCNETNSSCYLVRSDLLTKLWSAIWRDTKHDLPKDLVQREQHRIYVRDLPGAEPTIILMRGFPDNVHLYDRLSPYLPPPRRVVLFDFLGWGSSDKPSGYLTPPTIRSAT